MVICSTSQFAENMQTMAPWLSVQLAKKCVMQLIWATLYIILCKSNNTFQINSLFGHLCWFPNMYFKLVSYRNLFSKGFKSGELPCHEKLRNTVLKAIELFKQFCHTEKGNIWLEHGAVIQKKLAFLLYSEAWL